MMLGIKMNVIKSVYGLSLGVVNSISRSNTKDVTLAATIA